jgi:hypothetical protein
MGPSRVMSHHPQAARNPTAAPGSGLLRNLQVFLHRRMLISEWNAEVNDQRFRDQMSEIRVREQKETAALKHCVSAGYLKLFFALPSLLWPTLQHQQGAGARG